MDTVAFGPVPLDWFPMDNPVPTIFDLFTAVVELSNETAAVSDRLGFITGPSAVGLNVRSRSVVDTG